MLCRVSQTCVYNVPNFVSALIVSVATQQTIGALHSRLMGAQHKAVINMVCSYYFQQLLQLCAGTTDQIMAMILPAWRVDKMCGNCAGYGNMGPE